MSIKVLHGARRAALHIRAAAANLGWDVQPQTLFLVTGGGNWAVREIALGVQPHLSPSFGKVEIIDQVLQRPYLSRSNIHCLCRPAFFKGAGIPPIHSSNRLVVSWLHGGKKSREPEMLNACRQLERGAGSHSQIPTAPCRGATWQCLQRITGMKGGSRHRRPAKLTTWSTHPTLS